MDSGPMNAGVRLGPADQLTVRTKPHDRRATVGFLTANIHVGASRSLWLGVVDAAGSHGVNLICFPGGGLGVSEGFASQRNRIYDLIGAERFDGLVSWSSTVGGSLSPTEITDFHLRYHPLPMVGLTQSIAAVPTVSVDSYQGMRAAVIHLIEVHGYCHLAFVRGPEEHFHAQERYFAYMDVLQAYGLPVVPELITPPIQWDAGEAAVQILLDDAGLRPKVDIQAIVAVSDLTALGVLKALQARGIQTPTDMAVVGFNDSIEGRLATPPLTSVAMPFYEQGAQAITCNVCSYVVLRPGRDVMGTVQPADQPVTASQRWSVRMANSVIERHSPDTAKWHYEHGLVLKSVEQVWHATGEDGYRRFVKETVDLFAGPDGEIRTYNPQEYNLDQINPGKVLFPLHQVTGDERYKHAIMRLRQQLTNHPRTPSGGFWHKQIYPNQMWLDGIYMAAPFYAEFARTFDEPAGFDDVVHQIILITEHTRDPKTGLLYHAWDESKQQRWADPETGCSPHFWGRAMGWYAMAIVDVLDFLPEDHPHRTEIIAIFGRMAEALANVQDEASGLWYQVLDHGGREGNYLEASASCMFVYAIAKAVRKGYLPTESQAIARRGYGGIVRDLITVDAQGIVTLHGICSVAGLGGNPYRDGSYAYYVGEKVVSNDYKGIGPFILASLEMEQASLIGVE